MSFLIQLFLTGQKKKNEENDQHFRENYDFQWNFYIFLIFKTLINLSPSHCIASYPNIKILRHGCTYVSSLSFQVGLI